MTDLPDMFRESLRDLADQAEPTDLYAAAVHRSRRIARREATVGTGAALLTLGVLISGLWRMPSGNPVENPPAAAGAVASRASEPATALVPDGRHGHYTPPRGPAATGTPEPRHRESRPRPEGNTPAPRSRSLADLPGQIFYQGDHVVRLSPADGDTDTVLSEASSPVGVSPDGTRIAYEADGALLVAHTDDGSIDRVAAGVSTDDQAPAWSPAGDRLLVDAEVPAVVDVGSGQITPLPGDLGDGRQFRWSGDGSKLVYATSSCGLEVAGSTATSSTPVPVVGDPAADNPDGLAACGATSVDATGSRVTVPLKSAGGTGSGDAVVDTATGDVVPLPVPGKVVGAVFDPAGNLLVRTVQAGRTRLSLLDPQNRVLVRADEPAAVHDLDLVAYTR
jgi:TolB protein